MSEPGRRVFRLSPCCFSLLISLWAPARPAGELAHLGGQQIQALVGAVDAAHRHDRLGAAAEQVVVGGDRVGLVVDRRGVVEHLVLTLVVVLQVVGRDDAQVDLLHRRGQDLGDAAGDQGVDRGQRRVGRGVAAHVAARVHAADGVVVDRSRDAHPLDEGDELAPLADRLGDGAHHRGVGAAGVEVVGLGPVEQRPADEAQGLDPRLREGARAEQRGRERGRAGGAQQLAASGTGAGRVAPLRPESASAPSRGASSRRASGPSAPKPFSQMRHRDPTGILDMASRP